MSIDAVPTITSSVVVLGVVWDEVNGPSIVSKAPAEGLADPINIALQIYLSSVAVFGQHGATKKIDFSLPLLSISQNHIVRVAFDSWPDEEVRGDERPFFLGFIMERETDKVLADFIQDHIWTWMGQLKEKKMTFTAQPVLDQILKYLQEHKESQVTSVLEEGGADHDYTVREALDDLENASELWSRHKDRSVLSTVLKAAYRLDGSEAGNAYFLAGTIFFQTGDYENAFETYRRASEAFRTASDMNNSAESMFNAAVAAYRLERFDVAKTNLLLSSEFIADDARKARMFFYLGQTQSRLQEHESASHSFEVAVENALKTGDTEFAGQILSIYASRLQERADAQQGSKATVLYELAADQRQKASTHFSQRELFTEAATSLVLASKTYQTIKNFEKAIESLELAADMFMKENDAASASRALLDVISLYKKIPGVHWSELVQLTEKAIKVIEQLTEASVRTPLLSRAYRDKAKALEGMGDVLGASSCYEEVLATLGDPTVGGAEFLSLRLSYANLLFQLEDYPKAGDLFYQTYAELDPKSDRSQKILKNANISYKRGTSGFLQASNIFLHRQEHTLAADLYRRTLDLSKLVVATSPNGERESNRQWTLQTLDALLKKVNLFPKDQQTEFMTLVREVQDELGTTLAKK